MGERARIYYAAQRTEETGVTVTRAPSAINVGVAAGFVRMLLVVESAKFEAKGGAVITPAYARPVTAVATPFRHGREHPVSLFVRRPAER